MSTVRMDLAELRRTRGGAGPTIRDRLVLAVKASPRMLPYTAAVLDPIT